jgi:hypothetical protein
MEIVTAAGKVIATATPDGTWTWVNRALAPKALADLIDGPEVMDKGGDFVNGVCVTQFLHLKRGTPEWLESIHARIYNGYDPEILWRD